MKFDEILHRLRLSQAKLFSLRDLKRLLGVSSNNTAYKIAEKLVKKQILFRLKKGFYSFIFSNSDDFEIANYLYSPSYVSLESALNFYGILSQFPYTITSVTPRKTKRFISGKKEFDYVHVRKELFIAYEKEKNFLIARPEKALLDTLYLMSKGLRRIDLDELDYSKIDRRRLKEMAQRIFQPGFQKLLKKALR